VGAATRTKEKRKEKRKEETKEEKQKKLKENPAIIGKTRRLLVNPAIIKSPFGDPFH
jgi:hypothetical protein